MRAKAPAHQELPSIALHPRRRPAKRARPVSYSVAMSNIQPEQASFLLQAVYLPAYQNEYRVTKSVIEAIPADKADYKPDPNAKSAMELAWHIASAENLFSSAVAAGQFDFTPRPRPESIKTPADVSAWYSKNFESNVATLQNLSAEKLAQIVDFRGLFQLPAVMYLGFMMHHSVHHRGQLSTYLRPMGSKVPAIYGESYDSAAARTAAK